ncbi:TPA: hypothetical protein ACU21S_001563 [Mannheimia haemolytica]
MLLKEQGYDEFLAEKIRRGQEDVKAGRFFTAEQSRARTQEVIRKKAVSFTTIGFLLLPSPFIYCLLCPIKF